MNKVLGVLDKNRMLLLKVIYLITSLYNSYFMIRSGKANFLGFVFSLVFITILIYDWYGWLAKPRKDSFKDNKERITLSIIVASIACLRLLIMASESASSLLYMFNFLFALVMFAFYACIYGFTYMLDFNVISILYFIISVALLIIIAGQYLKKDKVKEVA